MTSVGAMPSLEGSSEGARPDSPDLSIPEGMSPDARETWPSRELINSWLGDADVVTVGAIEDLARGIRQSRSP